MAGISFKRGNNLANLPISDGQFIIHTGENAIYTDVGTQRIRLGDFIQVANVASLPANAHESALYYCIAENVLAKYSAEKGWTQINKQPTAEEMKTLLGLGSMAYLSEVAESNLSEALAGKVNDAFGAIHEHTNKTVLDGISAEKVAAWDAAEQNAKDYADGLDEAMAERVEALETAIGEGGSVDAQITAAINALDFTDTAVDGQYVSAVNEVDGKISVTRKALPDYSETYDAKGAAATALDNAKAYADGLASNYDAAGSAAAVQGKLDEEITRAKKAEGENAAAAAAAQSTADANTVAINAIKDDANIDSFADVVAELAKKQDAGDYATKTEAQGYADAKDAAIAEAKKAGDDAAAALNTYKTANDTALAGVKTTAEKGVADAAAVASDLANEVTRATGVEDAIKASIGTVEEGKTLVEMIADAQTNATYDDTAIKEDIKANTDAIAEIAKDYLTSEDEKALQDAIDANAKAIADETTRATGIEEDFEERISAIEDDYLTSSDKKTLQDNIDTLTGVVETLRDGIDAEKVDGVKDLIDYVDKHGAEVTGMKEDIADNAEAIDVLNGDATTEGSVAKTVKDAVDALKIGDYAKTTYVDTELAKKVDKEDGKSLVSDTEITKLAGVSAGANKVESSATNGSIKIDGVETVVYTHPEEHAISEVTGLQDALDALAASEDVYTKEEVDTAIDTAMTWGTF